MVDPMVDGDSASTLREIARRFGTPTYAFDLRRIESQVDRLREHLPAEVDVYYSLKANASLGICDFLAAQGLGADVASAGELATAIEAGFEPQRIFVAGPFKQIETIERLRSMSRAVLSADSPDELEMISRELPDNPVVLRLRPDFGSCAVVAAGSESRFGFTEEDLSRYADRVASHGMRGSQVIGFHVFAGSQVLDTGDAVQHLRRAFELSMRTAQRLGIECEILDLGGGFGTPYSPDDVELDLAAIGRELTSLVERAAPARLMLELGRYLVAQSGWYLTRVLGRQTFRGRRAVVVDGGTHQRADLCGLCLSARARPPVPLTDGSHETSIEPTDVLGSLSLPADVLAQSSPLPALSAGDVLAFADAGAYGVWSSPALFHGSPLPAEVAFDGEMIHVMRERRDPASILDGQRRLSSKKGPR